MNFYKLVNCILKEQGELPDTSGPDPELDPLEKSTLPTKSDLAYVDLIKLAVSSLFTEVEEILEKNINLRSDAKLLKNLRPVNKSNAIEAFNLIKKFVQLAGNPVPEDLRIEDLDFASVAVVFNLIINALFSSKKEIENSDPSISSQINKIAENYKQLKNLKDTDPIAAMELAKDIKNNIENILPTTNLQFT